MPLAQAGDRPDEQFRLRSDLRVFVRNDGRSVIEDPVQGTHYRLGFAEYRFVAHLGHTGSPKSAHLAVSEALPDWTPESSARLMNWCVQRRLVEGGNAPATAPPRETAPARQAPDLLFFRVSLGSADGWSASLARLLRPFLCQKSAWICVILAAIALVGGVAKSAEFSSAYATLMTRWGAITVAVAGLVLKVLHELGHCVACRACGGRVRDCGVLFICGAPLPFVDVSDSRRFPSRIARITVALAGVAVECLAAAIAVIVAVSWGAPAAYYVAAHLVLTCVVAALAFNLNPLMKYDGYYVLIELLGVDNLYIRGIEYVRAAGGRLFLGRKTLPECSTSLLVKSYGLASFAWRVLAMSTISCFAIWALHGFGLLLVAWTLWRSWLLPAIRAIQQEATGGGESLGLGSRIYRMLRPVAIGAVLLAVACILPMPTKTVSYATIEYDPPSIVHCPIDAFVEAVHVTDNQPVEQGDLLVTLRSDSTSERLAANEYAYHHLELQARSARFRQDMRELKVNQAAFEAAQEQRRQAASEAALLQVRSPIAGAVSARNLEDLVGVYLTEGTEIAAVGREEAKRLRVLADPASVDLFGKGEVVRFLSPTGAAGDAVVKDVLPRATRNATQSSLGGHRGGPLEVATNDKGEIQFSKPFTPIVAQLDRQQSLQVRVGQRVAVSTGDRKTLVEWVWEHIQPHD